MSILNSLKSGLVGLGKVAAVCGRPNASATYGVTVPKIMCEREVATILSILLQRAEKAGHPITEETNAIYSNHPSEYRLKLFERISESCCRVGGHLVAIIGTREAFERELLKWNDLKGRAEEAGDEKGIETYTHQTEACIAKYTAWLEAEKAEKDERLSDE